MCNLVRRWGMVFAKIIMVLLLMVAWTIQIRAEEATLQAPPSEVKQEEHEERVIYVDAPPVETLPASEETKVQEDTIMVHEDGTVEYIINVDAPAPTEPEPEPESEPEPEVTYEYVGSFKLTAYCMGHCCNGENAGISAMGTPLVPYYTVAVDRHVIPLGTLLEINIPGDGWTRFIAEDTGKHVQGNRIDVCLPDHKLCRSKAAEKYNGRCEVRIVHASR